MTTVLGRTANVIALCLLATTFLYAQDADPAICSNATLNGYYAFEASGTDVAETDTGLPLLTPFMVAGILRADGAGNVTVFRDVVNDAADRRVVERDHTGGSWTVRNWGDVTTATIPIPPLQLTYTVNGDCTGSAQGMALGQPVFGFSFVLADGGREGSLIQTVPGPSMNIGRFRRLDASNAALNQKVDDLTEKVDQLQETINRIARAVGLIP